MLDLANTFPIGRDVEIYLLVCCIVAGFYAYRDL